MNIFVAGATGAIGRRLVPILAAKGHRVTATTRSPEKLASLRALGAEPIVMDGLDRESVQRAVQQARPEAIIHQMTALASFKNLKHFDQEFKETNRLRTEGTEQLLAAARTTGTRIFAAQSYAGWPLGRSAAARRLTTEDEPFDPAPVKSMAATFGAIRKLEGMVTSAPGILGIVLRYGGFYGPGTTLAANGGEFVDLIKHRRLPIVGEGRGVWSFIHVEDAARATAAAVERAIPGVFNIADDQPSEVREWVPQLAQLLGAPAPTHFPVWLARFALGEAGVFIMTGVQGVSNAKAKRVLGWQPLYPSWRDGLLHDMSQETGANALSRSAAAD